MNKDVTSEIDGENGHVAWSVVVRGTAKLLDEVAAHRADGHPLRPWVSTYKYNAVEITPRAISGRRFELDPHARHLWLGK